MSVFLNFKSWLVCVHINVTFYSCRCPKRVFCAEMFFWHLHFFLYFCFPFLCRMIEGLKYVFFVKLNIARLSGLLLSGKLIIFFHNDMFFYVCLYFDIYILKSKIIILYISSLSYYMTFLFLLSKFFKLHFNL